MGGLTRFRPVLVICVLALTLIFVSGAFGATTTLQITGKRHVKVGTSTTVVTSGFTTLSRGIAIFVDKRDCAQTYVAERARGQKRSLLNRQLQAPKPFRFSITFQR